MIEWANELIGMDEEGYRARYRDTALTRPRRDGMLRNLCVGLGNSGDPGARDTLERCARDDSPLVREHARWALEHLG
jgi:epoxyqueuosine reductase